MGYWLRFGVWVFEPAWTLPLMTYAISYICIYIHAAVSPQFGSNHWCIAPVRQEVTGFSIGCLEVSLKALAAFTAKITKLVKWNSFLALLPDFYVSEKKLYLNVLTLQRAKSPSLHFRRTFKCLYRTRVGVNTHRAVRYSQSKANDMLKAGIPQQTNKMSLRVNRKSNSHLDMHMQVDYIH